MRNSALGSNANIHLGKLPPKLLSSSLQSPPYYVVSHHWQQHYLYSLCETCKGFTGFSPPNLEKRDKRSFSE